MDVKDSSQERLKRCLVGCQSDTRQDSAEHDHPGLEAPLVAVKHLSLVLRHRSVSLGSLVQNQSGSHTPPEDHYILVSEQYENLKACRANRTALRSEFQAAKELFQRSRKRYNKARAAYETAIDPFAENSKSSSSAQDMVNIRSRLTKAEADLESQGTQVRSIKTNLQAARASMERAERDFMDLAHREAQQFKHQNVIRTGKQASDTRSVRPASSLAMAFSRSEQNALQGAYFRKAGDLNNLGEQLAEHNYDYWIAIAERDRRQDQDEVLTVPDEEFEADALKRREAITNALNKAIQEADELKMQCETANIDLDPHRRNIWDVEETALSETELKHQAEYRQTFEAVLATVPPEAFQNAEVLRADASDDASEHADSPRSIERRIGSWVEDLDLEHDSNGRTGLQRDVSLS